MSRLVQATVRAASRQGTALVVVLGLLAGQTRADANLGDASAQSESGTPAGISSLRGAGWMTLGGSAVLLGSATLLNVAGRERMENCRFLYAGHNLQGARSECNAAKPPGYASYALFAAGAAAGALGIGLLLWPSHPNALTVSLAPTDGLSLRLDGKF